jgi:hypothetical protein
LERHLYLARRSALFLLLGRSLGLFERSYRSFMSLPGVLHRLLRKFMGGQVVFLIGVRHRNAMCVRGQFVKFRGPLMRIVRHDASSKRQPSGALD